MILGGRLSFATIVLAPEPYFATSYALLMGNDAYGNGWPDLKNGVNDAEEMATELERHGFHTVVKRNLRRRELIEALETFFIKTGSDPDARLLVWFSGHGHTVNGEGYLVPSGAPGPDNDVRFRQGAVSVREFGRLMREARSRHVLAILDSCFSGTVFANVRSSLPPPVSQVTNLPVRQFISSGKAGELVSDNGRFRELVIETLSQRRPAADPDQDGYLLGSNLGQFLFEQVSQETGGRQNPQYGKLDDSRFNQGDFVFRTLPLNVALTPSAPPEARPVDARPKTSVHQAVEVAAREAASVHAMVGTPALVGLAGLLMFLWRWRTHGRDLMELAAADGTAQQLADEQKNARRELLRPATYRQRLQAWLNWLSARLGGAHPWGADAYDAMFKLAVAYPIIGVLLVWVITGENTSGIEGLLPEADAISRMAAIGSLAALAVALVGYRSSRGWSRLIWFGAFAFAGAFAGAVAVAVAGAFAGAVAVAFAGAVAGAGAVLYSIGTLIKRRSQSIAHGVTWVLLGIAIAGIARTADYAAISTANRDLVAALLTFLAALPLINVVFDWLSLGLTRWLLARTARGAQPILNGIVDAFAAIVILIALAVATTAALQGLNTLAITGGADQPLIDLAGVLQTLRERPGDPAVWWVYFMLFSTLIPSVVHLFIAASSLVSVSLPGFVMRRHLSALEAGFAGHPKARRATALTITVREFLSWGAFALALAAIIAVGFGLTNIMPWVGLAILWVAEWTAYWLNAPITPGAPPWA